jgi:hypothetical protein
LVKTTQIDVSFFYTVSGDKMKIYHDYVMIINFFFDFILLMAVSFILKRGVELQRIIFGSFLGGLSILLLFFNLNSLQLFFYKLVMSLLMILVTFGSNFLAAV